MSRGLIRLMGAKRLMGLISLISLASCVREPELHLYDEGNILFELPIVQLQLEIYWNYELGFGITYDWKKEWYYGKDNAGQIEWDDEDKRLFGELEYEEPTRFHLRRYFTSDIPYGKRIKKEPPYYLEERFLRTRFDPGYWDILAWNDVKTLDGVQSLHFEEQNSLDEPITAYTNQSMYSARYHTPRYQNAFYQPEQLFSACSLGEEISKTLDSTFVFDEERNVWVKQLNMILEPITYIYLPQIILHNNDGSGQSRIKELTTSIANLSGMARSTNLNTGVAGTDAVAVNFNMRMKYNKTFRDGEIVDIVGGRLMTFGICGQNANRVSRADENIDTQHHYIDVEMRFDNDMDSTIVFDVTDSIRKYYKGGVITMELDMKNVPPPVRSGGSGFNAIVEDFEKVQYDFSLGEDKE